MSMLQNCRLRMGWLALVLLVLWAPVAASAQSVTVNPTKIVFTPSGDHDKIDPLTGQPMVSTYKFQFWAQGSAAPITEIDLGKGTPITALDPQTPDAKIGDIIAKPAGLVGIPAGIKYIGVVVAVAFNGMQSLGSNATDPFGRATPPAVPTNARMVK